MSYTQLTQEERYQIYILKKAEYSQAEIAELLNRDKSTISRELWRYQGRKGYRPKQAHHLVLARRHNKTQPRIGDPVWQQVEALIRVEWSPEQIVCWLEKEKGFRSAMGGSTSTITQTSAQAVTCTVPCAVRRPGATAMASMTGVAASPTRSR